MWEQRPGTSPLVRSVWRAEVEEPDSYTVAGSEYWGISFVQAADGGRSAVLDGPSLSSRRTESILGERYWGVELASHVVVPGLAKHEVLGAMIDLPVSSAGVELGGHRMPFPAWDDDLDAWAESCVAAGALVADAAVRDALVGRREPSSDRTWQRRYRHTVGLTSRQLDQLRRARHAYALLQSGVRPAQAAVDAGYADQAHLTRALRLIRDETPAAVLAAHARG